MHWQVYDAHLIRLNLNGSNRWQLLRLQPEYETVKKFKYISIEMKLFVIFRFI